MSWSVVHYYLRELLATYYTIHQQPHESVADFRHRFCEVQNQLQKLLPGIHKLKGKDGAGEDLELIYAFTIKLREDIAAELVSREFKYTSLQSVIDAARPYEEHKPDNINSASATPAKKIGLRQPEALYHQSKNGINVIHSNETCLSERFTIRPRSHIVAKPTARGSPRSGFFGKSSRQPFPSQVILLVNLVRLSSPRLIVMSAVKFVLWFNKRYKSNCELSNNKCKYGRQHVCQVCSKFDCKKANHRTKSQQTGNVHDKSVCQPQFHQAYSSASGHQ